MSDLIERAKAALEGATPGPWEANHSEILSEGTGYYSPVAIISTGEDYGGYYGEDADVDAQKEANADLIALAPDLARLAIAAAELAAAAKEVRNIANLSFAAGVEEREGGSGRRQGKLVDDYERRISAINDTLARFRAIAEGKE